MTRVNVIRAVERCDRLAALGSPPPWWRMLALWRWLAAYRAIMALDISEQAEMLREIYSAEQLVAAATTENPWLRMMPRGERSPMRRYIEPVEYTEFAAQQLNQRRSR